MDEHERLIDTYKFWVDMLQEKIKLMETLIYLAYTLGCLIGLFVGILIGGSI